MAKPLTLQALNQRLQVAIAKREICEKQWDKTQDINDLCGVAYWHGVVSEVSWRIDNGDHS